MVAVARRGGRGFGPGTVTCVSTSGWEGRVLVLRRAGRRAGAARGEWWAVPRVNCGRVELWDWGAAGWAKPECGLGLGYRDMRINERAGGGRGGVLVRCRLGALARGERRGNG